MPKLNVNDIELYYESTGQGKPIVLIHGLGSSTRDWEPQTAFFSNRFQVVTFDLRGHGRSQKPPGPYSISLFARDTAALIQALQLGPVHLVGISLGGSIAFQLAVDEPELLRSLVIVNSGPEAIFRTLKERTAVLLRQLIVRLLGMRKMGETLSSRLFPKEEHEELRRSFTERWAENDPKAYLASLRAIVNWSVADRLHTISVPTLVVAADQDYTPLSLKEAYVSKMQQAELVVIEDCRHATTIERPEQFNEKLMAFLAKQAP